MVITLSVFVTVVIIFIWLSTFSIPPLYEETGDTPINDNNFSFFETVQLGFFEIKDSFVEFAQFFNKP